MPYPQGLTAEALDRALGVSTLDDDPDDIIEAMTHLIDGLETWRDLITAQMLPLHPLPQFVEVLDACKRVREAAEERRDR